MILILKVEWMIWRCQWGWTMDYHGLAWTINAWRTVFNMTWFVNDVNNDRNHSLRSKTKKLQFRSFNGINFILPPRGRPSIEITREYCSAWCEFVNVNSFSNFVENNSNFSIIWLAKPWITDTNTFLLS